MKFSVWHDHLPKDCHVSLLVSKFWGAQGRFTTRKDIQIGDLCPWKERHIWVVIPLAMFSFVCSPGLSHYFFIQSFVRRHRISQIRSSVTDLVLYVWACNDHEISLVGHLHPFFIIATLVFVKTIWKIKSVNMTPPFDEPEEYSRLIIHLFELCVNMTLDC